MRYFPAAFETLTEQFARLPGIGSKSAQRLAFFVLSLPEEEAKAFADAIVDAKRTVTFCPVCRNLTDGGLCPICSSPKRDEHVICVVADPRDVVAIERARGKYLQFVDSDDQLDPNATRLLVEAAEETQADLVICNYCSVMPDGKTTVHGFMQPYTRMDKAQFARCLMEEPASFYYGVMWNKLYRREIIMAHDIRCDEEFTWSEDMLFNLSYIRYADSFYAIRTPLYYYSRRRKHSLSASVNPAQVVTTKASLFKYYKELYVQLGLYDQYKLQIYSYLVATAKDLD